MTVLTDYAIVDQYDIKYNIILLAHQVHTPFISATLLELAKLCSCMKFFWSGYLLICKRLTVFGKEIGAIFFPYFWFLNSNGGFRLNCMASFPASVNDYVYMHPVFQTSVFYRTRKILKNEVAQEADNTKTLVAQSHFWLVHPNLFPFQYSR